MWADERASAAVEFVVLIPVYMLMMTALFMIGNLAQVRQGVVAAARYEAWYVGPAEHSYKRNQRPDPFFRGIQGTYGGSIEEAEVAFPVKEPEDLNSPQARQVQASQFSDIYDEERDRVGNDTTDLNSNAAAKVAAAAFNNVTRRGNELAEDDALPFTQRIVSGYFVYRGITIMGVEYEQRTVASVLLPRANKRREYKEEEGEDGGWHPVFEWGHHYDPLEPAHLPLAPTYPPYFDRGDGIWDPQARIKGSAGNEWSFFDGQQKPE